MSPGTAAVPQFMMPHIWVMPGKQIKANNFKIYNSSVFYLIRSYISFDILRRVLANFFGYNIQYVMNITDIDDKIIKRARQNYLYDRYVASNISLEQLLNDQKEVLSQFEATCARNTDADKKIMLQGILERMNAAVESLTKAVESGNDADIAKARSHYLAEAKDPIADWIDKKEGSQVSDNAIFETLPRYWEDQFHNDMKSLNVSFHLK